ncbi:MAG: class I SAM-dependent methyltransferase, partial [Candidatus Omnitrophica bacterium]|nr:class I SAM-dependent methyltransferase [Candidatus Omnitrophota bacterium]
YFKGYKRLYGCDIRRIEYRHLIYTFWLKKNLLDLFKSVLGRGPIRLSRQDLQKTDYPSAYFDFITSISVIEHGIDLQLYCQEMARLLKPGGHLITSCDYWPEYVDTSGIMPYGLTWNILSKEDIEKLISQAGNSNLSLIEPVDLDCNDPVIEWRGKKYTFIFLVWKKNG